MTTDVWVPQPHAIASRRRETADTFTVALKVPRGARRAFRPGQFNMVYLFGVGEVPVSISGDPFAPGEIVHTIRVVGAITRGLGALRVGDTVGVRGPFGTAWPVESALGKDVVVIAGGIGLAPLRPVLYEVSRHRDRYRRVVLLYGARRATERLYPGELRRWGRLGCEVATTVDAAGGSWKGHVGVVPTLIEPAGLDPAATVALLCGPEIMMRFCARELLKIGVPEERIHLSMERNMKCAVGFCGHCQYGPRFVCRDGPVFAYPDVRPFLETREW